eukprot:1364764-Pyramimonas_sp.AAC.1
MAEAKNRQLQTEDAIATTSAKQSKSRKSRNLRYRNLWAPSAKFVVLSGLQVVRDDGSSYIERDASKQQDAIHTFWAKQFMAKDISEDAQHELLATFGRRWDVSSLRPPDTSTFYRYLRSRSRSAPGPDGIPYPALLISIVIESIAEVAELCYQGVLPFRAMAYSSLATPPKGQYDHDAVEVIRSPDNLRPLSGRNADAK